MVKYFHQHVLQIQGRQILVFISFESATLCRNVHNNPSLSIEIRHSFIAKVGFETRGFKHVETL